ncbi:MAG: UvrD-helicase domain-containing protein [Ignavibacteriales bacterium]|nr:UvrD-helicase domain-containing protein [Ignavibacteriales bacterium]
MPQLTPYQKEALDYKSNILLSANAGSGKTFVLSKRFVEIILSENAELDSIVAITFTDKAAGELNKKIAKEIEDRLEIETAETNVRKLESVRRQLVSANISTIHSFCVNVLREFAPEAGIDANFLPVDQYTADELLTLAVDESINHLISSSDYENKLKYLIRFFGSKRILVGHLTKAVEQRKIIDQHLSGLYAKSEEEIAEHFQKIFEVRFDKLFQDKIERLKIAATTINDFVLNQPKTNETASSIAGIIKKLLPGLKALEKIELLKLLAEGLLTDKGTIKVRGYLNKSKDDFEKEIGIVETIFSELDKLLEVETGDNADTELARFGKNFLDIYSFTEKVYQSKKQQKGYLDFEDILLHAQKILELNDVKEYLRSKFKYIMIDEYQDTNELQYKIFMPILSYLQHGNLFVVGDEKQSIYMFRDADLRIFNKTKTDIVTAEKTGKLLSLPHSFRMAPQLVLFTNRLFANLFEGHDPELNEVEYSELVCAKDENEKGAVEFLLADKEKNISETELTVNKIIELTTDPGSEIDFSGIGILCRKRNLFEELEKELTSKKIPYTIVGGKGFYQRQTIYDIYNYLTFLLNTNDDSAFVGILRSPFFNFSDTEIFELSLEEGNNFFQKLNKYSHKSEQSKKALKRLNEHLNLALSSEIYTLIRRILLDSGYWAVVAAKKNSKQEIANLEKLLVLVRTFTQKSFKNLYDFAASLRESIETMDDEGQAQITKEENSVKLLTIHQAKGLEYKAVFLYGCNGYAKDDSVKTRGLNIDKDFGFLAKVPLNENYFEEYAAPPASALYNYINRRKNYAEIKRLLYVAVTRAMNKLYICVEHKEYKSQSGSFFEMFCSGLNPDFEKDNLKLNGTVDFMKSNDSNYEFYDKEMELEIKFARELKAVPELKIDEEEKTAEKIFHIEKIEDSPKKEIISATKLSMFRQCPVKYELTYDLGFSTIYDLMKKHRAVYEFNYKEDDELKLYADVKGRVIHSVLKENITREFLDEVIRGKINSESINDLNAAERLQTQIKILLEDFYNSKSYSALISEKKFRNEIEIYCEEVENYLYGIIDKLIFAEDKFIIVDYKTDDIGEEQLKERSEDYFHQLKFYSYILGKLYKDYSVFELRLVFLKYPEKVITQNVVRSDFIKYQTELDELINKILAGEYEPNLNHCGKCHFALEGNKCVKF